MNKGVNGGFSNGPGIQQNISTMMNQPGRGGGKGKDRFQDPNNVSMLSIPKQTKVYIDRLR